jgi:chloramphenicol-sensitive protein RarD
MKKGIWYGLGAYLIWGFLPLYLKQLHQVPPVQILGNRIVWSFVFLALALTLRKDWPHFRRAVQWRMLPVFLVSAGLLAGNWLMYIWGVNSGYIVETSLGYYINPLVSVLLGVVVLRERLRPMQWLPIGIAALGVFYLTYNYGGLPWLALALALTFGLYGLAKKKAPLGSLYGLTVETGLLFLPALGILFFAQAQGVGGLTEYGWTTTLLLIFAGVVTSVPLLMFGAAARQIDLSLLGVLQYVAPTLQFMIGVFVYKEPFDRAQLVGFSMIWLALAIFWIEGVVERRRVRLAVSLNEGEAQAGG